MEDRTSAPEVPAPKGGDGAAALPYDAANGRWLGEICEALGAAVVVSGADGRITRVHGPAAELLGRPGEDLVGSPVPAAWAGLRVTRRAAGEETLHVLRVPDADPDRNLLLRQAEALRGFGALCHKINNPLTALMGRAQLLQARKGADPAVIKAAEVIQESASRVTELVRELALAVKDARRELPEEPEATTVSLGTAPRTPA